MSNEFIGLALGTVSEKLTPEQAADFNLKITVNKGSYAGD